MSSSIEQSETIIPAPPRRLASRAAAVAFAAALLVLFAGWRINHARPGSETLKRVGVFTLNNLSDPAFLTRRQRDELTRMRFRALNEAATVLDSSATWQAAAPRIQALYDREPYRGDDVAQQLVSMAFVRGMLLRAAPSPQRDRALLDAVERHVAHRGIDSVTVFTGLSRASATADPARVARVRARAQETLRDNERINAVRTCEAPAADLAAVPRVPGAPRPIRVPGDSAR